MVVKSDIGGGVDQSRTCAEKVVSFLLVGFLDLTEVKDKGCRLAPIGNHNRNFLLFPALRFVIF